MMSSNSLTQIHQQCMLISLAQSVFLDSSPVTHTGLISMWCHLLATSKETHIDTASVL